MRGTRDRVRGCFIGGAVGDALGAPIEFMSLTEIRERFGPAGVTSYVDSRWGRGAFTDDTQMTLFTAEGLIRFGGRVGEEGVADAATDVWRAYLRWLMTQGESWSGGPDPASILDGWLYQVEGLHDRRAPGHACLCALRTGRMGSVADLLNDSKGCGGVMRVAPIGFATDSAEVAFDLGSAVAAVTHSHPSGYLAAGAFAVMVHSLTSGGDMVDAVAEGRRSLKGRQDSEEVTTALDSALTAARIGPPSAEVVEGLGQGWVAEEALAMAAYCALVAEDFPDGVLLAVNHSGDSDSTAASPVSCSARCLERSRYLWTGVWSWSSAM